MIALSRKNILLVEDEAIIALLEKSLLEKYGYAVVIALTGEKAIELAREVRDLDLILMDIDLGKGITGTEAAGIILHLIDIPLIFLSSHTEPEMVEKTENISSYGYVVKSSSITVLDASIKMAFKLFEANRKIERREEKQSAMIAHISDVLGIVGRDGKIRYLSPNVAIVLGWDPRELLGTDATLLVHDDDIGEFRRNYALLLEKANSMRIVECRYRCKDGTSRTVELTLTNLNEDPMVQGMLLSFHDISERKREAETLVKSETRYRRLFETAQDGILILDAESGRIVDVNPFLIDMLGYSKDQFVEKTIWEIGFFKDIIANKENFLELQREKYVRYEDLPLETASGKTMDVEFISNVYEVDDLKVIQCNIRDITERKLSEALLQKSFREKAELLRELQHRVKNSFAMISIMINLATNNTDSPEGKTALRELELRVGSVSELYSILYESGSFTEVRLDMYCSAVAHAVIGLSGDISLASDMEAIIVPAKQAAPVGLILTELLTNTVKYAFPEGRKGSVALRLGKTGDTATLEVSDDGAGLPAGFDPTGSAGIGLKLVLGLTEQIGGSFRMDGPGIGTRCKLEFAL
jgi:PAS domain S-box-containing protein